MFVQQRSPVRIRSPPEERNSPCAAGIQKAEGVLGGLTHISPAPRSEKAAWRVLQEAGASRRASLQDHPTAGAGSDLEGCDRRALLEGWEERDAPV